MTFNIVQNKLKTIYSIHSTQSCVKARAQLVVKVGMSVLCNSDECIHNSPEGLAPGLIPAEIKGL
jgi:hypothetical protein